ncbi:MAG: 2-oxoglutarate dehydrogenase complex dihydrolipoyllysine-residue succinyltransferase [Roseiflexus sp.]|nr:2-oxoglutarate dehydrogenase complex dihydrolipoyllysine-residue succinyltransferase [Roseiflexus sp.]MCS7289967.1 2-oxoglutarate dehydrogenase complex dihydrolipoyllysine-residue succinyltransferase [Roseiflexus sp.]MDW8233321.1 2-oxoglutarate dehydrogenase complex dihydrolipoyllysine-residue succinyltransferase [Roseiflexaceae bacterium]
MAVEIKVPTLGESIVEATVGAWRKHEGDPIVAGEVLVELETDKVTVEVTATESGVLSRILKPDGAVVTMGETLGIITETAVAPVTAQPHDGTPGARVVATPVARRVAETQGVDIAAIPGSGPGGRVTKEDVLKRESASRPTPATYAPPPLSAPAPPSAPIPAPVSSEGRREERVRMSRRRQTIAARLVEAQRTAAMLTTFNEIDMSAVIDLRKRHREQFRERHGVDLGFMSFFTKAVIGALKAFPLLNAEIRGDEIIIKRYYDIGIAVSTDEGLVVPVLRNADRLSFAEIERGIEDLARRARESKLTIADLEGGTFTITNGGVFGSLMSTPILNTPQVGILGMHKIQERPVALNGQVVIRPMMYVALSYDHRLIDGREAVSFLVRVKELVEDPERLLLEG